MSGAGHLNAELTVRLHEVTRAIAGRDINMALVGGLAVTVWGEPRTTYDIDFVVTSDVAGVARLKDAIESTDLFLGEPEELKLQRLSIVRALIPTKDRSDAIVVDFLCVDAEFAQSLLNRRILVPFAGEHLPVASPEDMLILKLQSGRGKDLDDARGILREQGRDLDRAYLQSWIDRFELRAIAEEIGLDID